MSGPNREGVLVFTDLDGSLMDHHDYGFDAARPLLARLEQLDIPVIPCSSKTRAEIEQLRRELGNGHPFIAENGAAVYIPAGYFAHQPEGTVLRDGYWIRELSPPRSHWLAVLEPLATRFPGEFDYFYRAGTAGIAALTGLDEAAAARANQREYSEPVSWVGSGANREHFLALLAEAGASVLRGGRFLAVAGDCDKGRALAWLRGVYGALRGWQTCRDLAIGDSGNDVAMLEAAQTALVIRSPSHPFPVLARQQGVIRSEACGPAGWVEGVELWLRRQQART